ncbi:hypothetical protein M413DRAFT_28155 [Hebeloma cylindrosporum]|nr:hypothetical protein M413DRAFT_28155 [Hebeloma cylindrosporum h7]
MLVSVAITTNVCQALFGDHACNGQAHAHHKHVWKWAVHVWEPATVLLALKKIAEVRRTIAWAPLKEVELQVWEAMIAGAAEAAGLEVDQCLHVVKDTVTDAEEKADKANKRGWKKKIVASTMDASDQGGTGIGKKDPGSIFFLW